MVTIGIRIIAIRLSGSALSKKFMVTFLASLSSRILLWRVLGKENE